MFRRFLDGFEQGVPCAFGEHVDFVDDIDFIFGADRQMENFLADFARLFHLGMGGGVDFDHIDAGLVGNGEAGFALTARFPVDRMQTVQRLGEDSRRRCFSNSAWSDEEIRLRDPSGYNRIPQCAGDVFLSDHIGKFLRSPFTSDHLISHFNILFH